MATINPIDSNIPIEVAKGGTGAATFTAHGVLVGNTTSAVAVTAAGTTGQILIATTSADPTFQTYVSRFDAVSADPGSPVTGQVWFNTTSGLFKGYNGSAVKTFTVT